MELTVDTVEGFRCVKLVGRLDLKGTQEVDLKFTGHVAGNKQPVLVDLSQVDYIASIGIRMFLSNVKALSHAKAKMVFLNPQRLVEDVLKLAGLDTVIPIKHDVTEAVALLKSAN